VLWACQWTWGRPDRNRHRCELGTTAAPVNGGTTPGETLARPMGVSLARIKPDAAQSLESGDFVDLGPVTGEPGAADSNSQTPPARVLFVAPQPQEE